MSTEVYVKCECIDCKKIIFFPDEDVLSEELGISYSYCDNCDMCMCIKCYEPNAVDGSCGWCYKQKYEKSQSKN